METKNLLFALLLLAMSSACSHIDDDERFIYVKPAEVARGVLIEDFTGQRCSNCPTAIDEIARIQSEYGEENVIAVGIHSGPLGFAGNATRLGLMTDTGNEYYNAWGTIDHQPMGVVNRRSEPSDYTAWEKLVYDEIQQTTPVTIGLTSDYNSTRNTANIQVEMFSAEATQGKLQLWITEDSITAMQTMPDGTVDKEYVHNHVFRAANNGTWGDAIQIDEGETLTRQYTLEIDTAWKARNLSVVAFIYNNDGVMQVRKCTIK